MTLDSIYRIVQYLGAKDFNGEPFTIVQLNRLLPMVVQELYSGEMTSLFGNKIGGGPSEVSAISMLNPFKKSATLNLDSYGVADKPADYVRYLSFRVTYPIPGGTFRDIDPVSEQEFNRVQGGMFNRRAGIRPIVKVENVHFNFCPYDLGAVILSYLRKPTAPYYDYCQDSNLNAVYMPTGSYLVPTLTTDVYNLMYDTGMVSITLATDVTKSGADWSSSPSYTSLTVELEFDEDEHIKIISRLLVKCGLNLSEPEISKAALQMQQQGN
jgi:hypothetical protein